MKSINFPTVREMLGYYWPILLIAIMPGITFSIMMHMVEQNQWSLALIIMVPFFIVSWFIQIGLGLHIVDQQLEPIAIQDVIRRGATFFGPMFRASLLVGTVMFIAATVLSFGLSRLGIQNSQEIGQLVAGLVFLKWSLFIEPVLYRDRQGVRNAWTTAKNIPLAPHIKLLLLYLGMLLLGTLPLLKMQPIPSISLSLVSLVLTVILNLWALYAVCKD